MPEGPMIVLYAEVLSQFQKSIVEEAISTTKTIKPQPVEGTTLTGIQTWGKYLFVLFNKGEYTIRVHWGMFGSYRIDDEPSIKTPKLTLNFKNGRRLRLYAVSLRLFEGKPSEKEYDPRSDVMNDAFNVPLALKKLKGLSYSTMICDALLDQMILAGVGNAIKTEALWAQCIHPEKTVHAIDDKGLRQLIKECVGESELFYEERRHAKEGQYPWTKVYRRNTCPRCSTKLDKKETGELNRVSYWCPNCQRL